MIIRNASIELGPGVSAEGAERVVRRALELVAHDAPARTGKVDRMQLPAVEVPAMLACRGTMRPVLSAGLITAPADPATMPPVVMTANGWALP